MSFRMSMILFILFNPFIDIISTKLCFQHGIGFGVSCWHFIFPSSAIFCLAQLPQRPLPRFTNISIAPFLNNCLPIKRLTTYFTLHHSCCIHIQTHDWFLYPSLVARWLQQLRRAPRASVSFPEGKNFALPRSCCVMVIALALLQLDTNVSCLLDWLLNWLVAWLDD